MTCRPMESAHSQDKNFAHGEPSDKLPDVIGVESMFFDKLRMLGGVNGKLYRSW